MNKLDDNFQSELLETLTLIQMHAGLLYEAMVTGEDVLEKKKKLQDTKDEAVKIISKIHQQYTYIPKHIFTDAIQDLVKGNLEPQEVITIINDKIDDKFVTDGSITASGKRKIIKRKTHNNNNRTKTRTRTRTRIKRKSHRRSYRSKKM